MSSSRRFKILITIICVAMIITMLSGCETTSIIADEQSGSDLIAYQGYTYVEYEGTTAKEDSFLACGTGGRLDRIYAGGNVENIPIQGIDEDLTCILSNNGIILVSGCSGVLLYSLDGQRFTRCKNVTDSDIVGLTMFKNKYFAAAVNGMVYSSDDGETWLKCADLPMEGIISFASTEEYIAAITSATDIFISTDGISWNQQNYNEAYEGYSDKYVFTKIVGDGVSLAILGYPYDNPSEPVMMTSSSGEVWMFQAISGINEKDPREFFPLSINHVFSFAGETLAVCDKGRLLTLTSCAKCHLISEVAQKDLRCIIINDSKSTIVAVGDDFEFAVLDAIDYRQDKIKAEQVLEDFTNYGALIIDVRTIEEFNELHISGALHIPVDQIESQLPVKVPDRNTEIIFYCAAGVRSQTALETARQMGYPNVFNLGGIKDWTYETERTSE